MNPHGVNDQYKYAGILVEADPHYSDVFYILDGQTGRRMTIKEVENMPTTMSDMWKDKGLVCVANVGVRGWCKCGRHVLNIVGAGVFFDETIEYDYLYTICTKCGKCHSNRHPGDPYSLERAQIMDVRIMRKYGDSIGDNISRQEYEAMLREAEDKLLAIPDGEIVIPGQCSCKKPAPLKVGVNSMDAFYVCETCGRVMQSQDSRNP